MGESYSVSETSSFTLTHAKHLAAKVATDLKRMQRLYDAPSDDAIAKYEIEVQELLKHHYLDTVTYGFRRNDSWIEPTLRYTAEALAKAAPKDDDPGRIRPGANVQGATFYSYLTYSRAWDRLTAEEQEVFRNRLPFRRTGAPEPSIEGYMVSDRTYSSGGQALSRTSLRKGN